MFVLLLYNANERKFIFYLCVDLSIQVEKFMWLFTISEWFLKKLFNFFTYSFKFFTLIYLWHLSWQNVNSWFFKYRGWCLYLMLVNLMLFRQSVDEKLICLAFYMKIVINLVSGKRFRLNHFFVWKSVQNSVSIEQIFFYHQNKNYLGKIFSSKFYK